MKKLLQFNDWYEDKILVCGFTVVSEKRYEELLKFWQEIDDIMVADNYPYISLYFGPNDKLIYTNIDDILDRIEITTISDEQADTIEHLFGKTYGYFPEQDLMDWLHDRIIERDMEK